MGDGEMVAINLTIGLNFCVEMVKWWNGGMSKLCNGWIVKLLNYNW